MPFVGAQESVGEAAGPNASLELGQVGQNAQLANSLKNANPAAYKAVQEPGTQGGPQAGGPGGSPTPQGGMPPPGGEPGQQPGQAPPGASQPPPMVTPQSARAMFDPPKLAHEPPWREGLKVLANHPKAGPWLKALSDLANKGQHPGGSPPTQA